MSYIFYNPNPSKKMVGDCVIRGVSRVTHQSWNDTYSGHSIKDRMVSQLEAMYDEAQTEHERQMVDEWIKRIETEQQ